ADAKHVRHPPHGLHRVAVIGELDKPYAVRKLVCQLPAEPSGEPAFADAAGSAERQRAYVPEKQLQVTKITLAADEAVRLRGQIAQTGYCFCGHSNFGRSSGDQV